MLFLIVPAGILFLSTVSIWLMDKIRKNVGISWLITIVTAGLFWIWTIYLHWVPDSAFQIGRSTFPGMEIPLVFQLDSFSRPYLMAISSLFLMTILTVSSRYESKTAVQQWIGFEMIAFIGMMGIASGGIWPVLLCWMIFDIIDLFFVFSVSEKVNFVSFLTKVTSIRLTGTLVAAVGLALSIYDAGGLYQADVVSSSGGILILVACAMRLGIVPIYQPHLSYSQTKTGLVTMLRFTSIFTVLPILCRIPLTSLSPDIATALSIFSGFAAFFCAFGWLFTTDTDQRKSYFITATASMAFACILRGQQQASIIWGVSMILSSPLFFLQHSNSRALKALLVTICFLFSGLPYTPNAAGWTGLIVYPFSAMDILFWSVHCVLLTGLFVHIFSDTEFNQPVTEPWMRSVYPIGILFTIGSYLLIASFNWFFIRQTGIWWASLASFVIAVFFLWGGVYWISQKRYQNVINWVRILVKWFLLINRKVLELDWFFFILRKIAYGIEKSVFFISDMIEGPGGILWEFLLLIAFIWILLSGRSV